MVDVEGYVALHSNRYSVPISWIGRRVEVRETKEKVEIQLDARHLVTHEPTAEAEHQRSLLAEHRPLPGQSSERPHPHPEEPISDIRHSLSKVNPPRHTMSYIG